MTKLYARLATAAAALALAAVPQAANALVTITFSQNGSDVTMSVAGNLDTTGLTRGTGPVRGSTPDIGPSTARVAVGANGGLARYSGITGPAAFGTNPLRPALSSYTGSTFQLEGALGAIDLANNFVSGGSLSGSGLFLNRTIAGLGLTTGVYNYNWNGATQLTVNVESNAAAAVPEPATWGLMLAGFGLAGGALRQRRRAAVRFA